MHKERVLDLADFLENEVTDAYFNMGEWTCGTAACIGGWCEARQMGAKPGDRVGNLELEYVAEKAEVYLGLSEEQEQDLFYPHFAHAFCQARTDHPAYISRTRAIATLRNLAETGEVVW